MKRAQSRSEDTRTRVLEGAGRRFRSHGFGGAGVDALAHEAGVTSGAFYGHFQSKAEAFREALVAGLGDLRAGIESLRATAGAGWRERFTDFYLGERRTCALAESCALQSLSVDAARADDTARAAYEAEWIRVRDAAADGFAGADESTRRANATALLALLAGGVSIARAVKNPKTSDAIARDVRIAALAIGSNGGSVSVPSAHQPLGRRADARVRPASAPDVAATRTRDEEDAWNARDGRRIAALFAKHASWRWRAEFLSGRAAVAASLERAFTRELDARRVDDVFLADGQHVVTRFACEWRDDSGHWYRSYGNELSILDKSGLVRSRTSSINDAPILESDRRLRWVMGPRPEAHPGLAELGL